ncbi:hypothetical protein, partial [Klebsiella pneumoniae]|uniref:hypothetical protein n=1 Tax=Klebsiella pneumoniae TaxID=573 RepID=UPI001C70A7CC
HCHTSSHDKRDFFSSAGFWLFATYLLPLGSKLFNILLSVDTGWTSAGHSTSAGIGTTEFWLDTGWTSAGQKFD